MPRHPTGRRKYQLQGLHPIHNEICRRLVLGERPKNIAVDLQCTPVMVSYTKNSVLGQVKMAELEAKRDEATVDVIGTIRDYADKALGVVKEILDNPNDNAPLNLRFKAAVDVLDRAGFSAVKRVQGHFAYTYLSTEQIEEIKQRGREMGLIISEK